MIYTKNLKGKLFLGSKKVKKAYKGTDIVYSAGNVVTYYVDSGVSYQEEVDSEASCLSPTSFTPTKSGWTFVGWRENNTASSSVLTSKVMGDDPISLYAVFKQGVTVAYYNNSTSASTSTKDRYYNNSNVVNPTFNLSQASKSGWTARGWSTGTAGNSGIVYNNATNFTRDSNITLYGMYQMKCTLTCVSYNNTTPVNGTAYYNSNGNTVGASVTAPTGAACPNWTWRGWSSGGDTSANGAVVFANGATVGLGTASHTIYGLYQRTLTLSYNGNGNTGGSTASQTGTSYWNAAGNYAHPTFTLNANGFSKTNYAFTNWVIDGVSYKAGATITPSDSKVAYASWVQSVYSYGCNDNVQTFTAPVTGTYRFDLYGAQGADGRTNVAPVENAIGSRGGYGGYTYGSIVLTAGQQIHMYVGGRNGYNGGGIGCSIGGGATHIATTARGILSNYISYTSDVLLVAGGGGGGGECYTTEAATYYGGDGGGTTGTAGYDAGTQGSAYCGTGGTQTSGGTARSGYNGSFGQGGSYASAGSYPGPGGGGGWYGGGAGSDQEDDEGDWTCCCGAGGGSGYVNTSKISGVTTTSTHTGDGSITVTLQAIA